MAAPLDLRFLILDRRFTMAAISRFNLQSEIKILKSIAGPPVGRPGALPEQRGVSGHSQIMFCLTRPPSPRHRGGGPDGSFGSATAGFAGAGAGSGGVAAAAVCVCVTVDWRR